MMYVVQVPLLLSRFCNIFHTVGKFSDSFRQTCRSYPIVHRFVDMDFGVGGERFQLERLMCQSGKWENWLACPLSCP